MPNSLPLLPTSVIGSYAWPAWLHTALAAAERGEYGPVDVEETLDDAVDLALRDQEDAEVDIISDGEMRRAGFFTAAFYGHLTGIRALPPQRLAGTGAGPVATPTVVPFDAALFTRKLDLTIKNVENLLKEG